tara:strand:+ start:666 stop:2018 length:1353 start_codon:yes stop_codon:yes gene_type:complete
MNLELQKEQELPPLRNILVIGSGGRENSLAWALAKSVGIKNVFVAPGNGGTNDLKGCRSLDLQETEIDQIIQKSLSLEIDLIVIGPEAPLANGISEKLRNAGLSVFGPSSQGAKLEASKSWAKDLMKEAGIPTANYWKVETEEEALRLLTKLNTPLVVKADGLAAGKGVSVNTSVKTTEQAIKESFKGKFGTAGKKVVLEELISGPEISIFALCDGEKFIILPPAQDHKRLLNGDKGPNTGGMGAYAPATLISANEIEQIGEKIIKPTIEALLKRGINYRGVIYAGLMITKSGPKVIEFNCRFGDPECQALMPLMGNELAKILQACAIGKIDKAPKLSIKKFSSACVVIASSGYPEAPKKGDEIVIRITPREQLQIFHAGSQLVNGVLITSGGRILSLVAQGKDFDQAFNNIYNEIKNINIKGMQYRSDIGYQVRNKEIIEEENTINDKF